MNTVGDHAVRLAPTNVDLEGREKPGSAVSKAFRVLTIIVDAERAVQLHEISQLADMPKPSTLRILNQLEDTGAVKRDFSGKRYLLGDGLSELALKVVSQRVHQGQVRDIMIRLVEQTGETCNLGVLDGNHIRYIERVESSQPLRIHLRAGSLVPLHATAVGKLTLAFMAAEKRRRLLDKAEFPRLTERTLSRETLLDQLPDIRDAGLAINREESTVGLIGVAVPVLDAKNRFLAGVALHAPSSRFDDDTIAQSVTALRAAALDISAALTE